MKRILIISPSEICYNPRLVKVIDFFLKKDCLVTIANTITGAAPKALYDDFFKTRKVICFENNINKKSIIPKIRWFCISIIHFCITLFWEKLNRPFLFPYILNKGIIGLSIGNDEYDIILINLIDSLPFAANIKKKQKNKPLLIYDSQEYFVGQYSKYDSAKYKWVVEAEKNNLQYVDIAICTTNAMKDKFIKRYNFKNPIFRVRNIPNSNLTQHNNPHPSDTIRIVWHGMSINYGNCRGVHIIVNAIAKCKTPVKLYLQGKKVEKDYQNLLSDLKQLGIEDKVEILDPVKPDLIVNSIAQYDIGLTGELPEEENQLLTSSNKLFEFIKAGLATIVSDLPGLRETIDEYKTGLLYEAGNVEELATKIDTLNMNRKLLDNYKQASINASKTLNWNYDFDPVWEAINNEN